MSILPLPLIEILYGLEREREEEPETGVREIPKEGTEIRPGTRNTYCGKWVGLD